MRELEKIVGATMDHHRMFRDAIPLIASENVTSLLMRSMLTTDFSHRYAEGKVGERYYQGCRYIDVIEGMAIKLAKRLFRAEHVNLQPISGMNANLAALFALTEVRDKIMSLPVPAGGHISHAKFSTAGIRGLRVAPIPFDKDEMNVDHDRLEKRIREVQPKVVILGASLFLFPHPVKEIRSVCDEVGTRIMYDGAHVLGLIAGGMFQDPLREGADVVTGSTHKTLPGPQRGMILCREALAKRIDYAVYPGTVSNHHLHHMAALCIALLEMMKFGRKYARDVIRNAKALAEELYNHGFDVVCPHKGFTESHQIAIDVSKLGGGAKVALKLERANIIVNKNLLPWDDPRNSVNPSGIRLGVQEVTRLGMGRDEMVEIARFIKMAVIDGMSSEKIRKEVSKFRRGYQRVHYSFDDQVYPGKGAYSWLR